MSGANNETIAVEQAKLVLSADEVAVALGISRAHLWRLHSAGRLPRPIRFGRVVRWNRALLERWLEAGAPSREKWETMLQTRQGSA